MGFSMYVFKNKKNVEQNEKNVENVKKRGKN